MQSVKKLVMVRSNCSLKSKTNKIDNLDEIIEALTVSRLLDGDMGIEVPLKWFQFTKKMVSPKVDLTGKVVITATNMLETMTENHVQLVQKFQAYLLLSTELITAMLSSESANGNTPLGQ